MPFTSAPGVLLFPAVQREVRAILQHSRAVVRFGACSLEKTCDLCREKVGEAVSGVDPVAGSFAMDVTL